MFFPFNAQVALNLSRNSLLGKVTFNVATGSSFFSDLLTWDIYSQYTTYPKLPVLVSNG